MPLSEYEELRQVAEKALQAWHSCNVGIDLETTEDQLEWEELVEAMGALGVVLKSQAKQRA